MTLSIPQIPPPSATAAAEATARQGSLTKPAGSLGRLESLATWYASVVDDPLPLPPEKVVYVIAADHGVARRGVSAYPPEVTAQMLANFAGGRAAVNVLARRAGARLVVVDAGAFVPTLNVLDRRIASGTADMTLGPAMTGAQTERAIANGIDLTATLNVGTIVVPGEMGIGNTTSAAALTAVLCGLPPRAVTGRGTGVDDVTYAAKVEAVERALACNEPTSGDSLGALASVGGFEIATLVGVILGAAARRCAVLLDGFISASAALVAVALEPDAVAYLQAGHRSAEPGHDAALRHLGLEPLLDLGLRLGEGSGAALAIPILEAARALLVEMATFEEAGVSRGEAVGGE